MTIIIKRFNLRALFNSEYSIFVPQITTILDKYDMNVLNLGKSYTKLKAKLPEVAKIKAQELGSKISQKLQELDLERDTLLGSIATQVKTMGKIKLGSYMQHAEVLDRLLDKHGRDIASAGYNAETKRIDDMLADYDDKAEIVEAALGLNLTPLFDRLREVNELFDNQFLQRTAEDAAVEKADARAIRTETDKVLTAFFNTFEIMSAEYDDLDYATPANEVNDLIAYYKTQLASRATRHDHKKDGGKDAGNQNQVIPEGK